MNIIKAYLKQLHEGEGNTIDIVWCAICYGASPNNYREFGFKKLSAKQRSTYVTNRLSEKMIKKYNKSEYVSLFEDKALFAEKFSEFFGRKWIRTEGMNKEGLLRFLHSVGNQVIYKPIGSAQGIGIRVYQEQDYDNIWEKIRELPSAIIEEWIPQHPIISAVYQDAVNCLRIITVYRDGITHFLAGGMTWGCGEKIANASATGIVSPVNFDTGVLEKPAADFKGNIYERHPYSSVPLVGFQLPYWNETKAMLRKAAAVVPQVGYVGWDIAITPTGPVLIEGNTTPGYKFYQIPAHMVNGIGNRKVYEQFL